MAIYFVIIFIRVRYYCALSRVLQTSSIDPKRGMDAINGNRDARRELTRWV